MSCYFSHQWKSALNAAELGWAAVNGCLKISRKHHDFMESYGYNLWWSDNFMTSEAGWDESSVCRVICYPASHTHWQWYSALLLAAITPMKFKVWIQTAFVFSFKKIKCVVLSSIDASPASRKCLLRPGQSLLVSSDRAHSSLLSSHQRACWQCWSASDKCSCLLINLATLHPVICPVLMFQFLQGLHRNT